MAVERTFVMIKPDAVKRGLVGEIIARFERKGLKIKALKMKWLTREEAEKLYEVHRGKPFFEELVEFITSGPVVAMILEGDSAVEVVRLMIGPTDGRKAPPGTIRGDFALDIGANVIHASDSKESFEREYKVFFSDNEIVGDY
ncbi:nucleoside-diphosphate kinase [Pyrodictium abyssi]|uniref:Nucleoside diphosphate kinase n=1 Tax=Pyrodictium abyssi TaxID=54256 RepID=A0ABM8IZM8_9CREN|nr:nucleoside-diphosphate kinase [Pyrodictium abyssi]